MDPIPSLKHYLTLWLEKKKFSYQMILFSQEKEKKLYAESCVFANEKKKKTNRFDSL